MRKYTPASLAPCAGRIHAVPNMLDFSAGLAVAAGFVNAGGALREAPDTSVLGPQSVMSPVAVSPLSHRRVDLAPSVPGQVDAVSPASLAMELGIERGDRIVGINGLPLVDALDFQFQAQAEHVILDVERAGVLLRYDLELEGDEFWGVTFADPTFDGVRICENACPFCFIKQIPKGMRRSLYVMDDDYRYSMLYGSFVTLTNLTEEDWRRIEEQHISPLHVSVHSTDPDLRVALVGNPKAGRIMEDLARLERVGIDFHAQLVLVPGVNDGPQLDRSLSDLATFGSRLCSIAGVPVGLSRHGQERQSRYLRRSKPNSLAGSRGTVACGELIAPTMRAAVERFNARTGAVLDTVAVENVFLGSEINVSGLLSGQDLLAAFARRAETDPLYISDRMVSQRTGTLLDDMTIEEVERALGRLVVPVADLSDVARNLRTRSRRQALVAA